MQSEEYCALVSARRNSYSQRERKSSCYTHTTDRIVLVIHGKKRDRGRLHAMVGFSQHSFCKKATTFFVAE